MLQLQKLLRLQKLKCRKKMMISQTSARFRSPRG